MQRPDDQPETDLTEVAAEPPEQSAAAEQAAVGEVEPDVGATVPPSQAQSARDDGDDRTGRDDEDHQPLLGGMMSSDKPESAAHD
jgi:hypothetical protein